MVLFSYFIAETILDKDHNPNIHIESALVSPFNSFNSQIFGKWDIDIFLRNPNKLVHITYHNFQVSLFYKMESLSGTTINSPVHQCTKRKIKRCYISKTHEKRSIGAS